MDKVTDDKDKSLKIQKNGKDFVLTTRMLLPWYVYDVAPSYTFAPLYFRTSYHTSSYQLTYNASLTHAITPPIHYNPPYNAHSPALKHPQPTLPTNPPSHLPYYPSSVGTKSTTSPISARFFPSPTWTSWAIWTSTNGACCSPG